MPGARRFGRLPLAQVLAPAIELAEAGHETNWFASSAICAEARTLRAFPSSAELFLPDGLPLRGPSQGPGDTLVQPRLARVLREIGAGGPDAFYLGRAARAIATTVTEAGGLLSEEDFAGYTVDKSEVLPVEIGPIRLYGPHATGVISVIEALQLVEAARRRGLDPGARLWARVLSTRSRPAARGHHLLGESRAMGPARLPRVRRRDGGPLDRGPKPPPAPPGGSARTRDAPRTCRRSTTRA